MLKSSPVHKPSVIFGIQKKVGTNDGDANSDDCQNDKHEEHEAVDVVNLVGPERCEHKVPTTPDLDRLARTHIQLSQLSVRDLVTQHQVHNYSLSTVF